MGSSEIDTNVDFAINELKKGQTPIQVRRNLIDDGLSEKEASTIAKEANYIYLQWGGKTRIIKGLLYFLICLLLSGVLFVYGNKWSYLACFGVVYGAFLVLSGRAIRKEAELINKL